MVIERIHVALLVSLKPVPRVNPPLLLRDLIRTCSITKSGASTAQFPLLRRITNQVIICSSIVIYSNVIKNMCIWKIETFSQYYIIFVDVNKIDLYHCKRLKLVSSQQKNDFKVCEVSLLFRVQFRSYEQQIFAPLTRNEMRYLRYPR